MWAGLQCTEGWCRGIRNNDMLLFLYSYIWKAPFNYMQYSESGSTVVQLPLVTDPTSTCIIAQCAVFGLTDPSPFSASVEWPATSGGWIKANVGQTGFYRVNYEITNWWALSSYLRTKSSWESMVYTCIDPVVCFHETLYLILGIYTCIDPVVCFHETLYLVLATYMH